MPIYKQTTELTECADWLTAAAGHDIQYVYFGDKEVFSVWATYDGTLPATYSANGDYLADYCIYGSAGGVGDKTENLFDPNAADVEKNCYYNAENVRVPSTGIHNESGFIPVFPGEYTFSFVRKASGSTFYVNFYDVNKNFVSNLGILFGATNKITVTIQDNGYVRFNFADYFITRVMFYRGSNLSWVPYGYEVDMSVSDGNTPTITQIYIGDTPLGENEYVDYDKQKIYRMSEGVLTPTDPPIPLPSLPTVDGTNIVDYAGQSAAVPSRFVAKYRKEDF